MARGRVHSRTDTSTIEEGVSKSAKQSTQVALEDLIVEISVVLKLILRHMEKQSDEVFKEEDIDYDYT